MKKLSYLLITLFITNILVLNNAYAGTNKIFTKDNFKQALNRKITQEDIVIIKDILLTTFRSVCLKYPPQIKNIKEICYNNPLVSAYLIIIFVVYWILLCFPLAIISRKFDYPRPWMAWLPIFNVLLSVKLADKNTWTAIIFFIPTLTLFFLIYIWCLISKALRQNFLLGIFIVIPVLNIILLWYLAFDRKAQYFGEDNDRRRAYGPHVRQGRERRKDYRRRATDRINTES